MQRIDKQHINQHALMNQSYFVITRLVFFSSWILLSLTFTQSSAAENIQFRFFSEIVNIPHNPDMFAMPINGISEESFKRFYYDLSNVNYHGTVRGLLKYKKQLRLNDWFHYLLIRKYVEKVCKDKSDYEKTLFHWFFLHKSGYTVQLNYVNSEVLLSVFTTNKLYNVPVRKHNDGWFVDLTAYHRKNAKNRLATHRARGLEIHKKGIEFDFRLRELPRFTNPIIKSKPLAFVHDNKLHRISVNVNETVVQAMYKYPELSVQEHTTVPLSIESYGSLIEELGKLIEGKNQYESIRLLLSFTRQALDYKEDQAAYKVKNLTFSSEETLYYPFSDCEDRSVLFHYLVRQLLGADVILLDYPEHATTAVLLDEPKGLTIMHKNERYTLCDPTGPGNHLKPGQYPEGLINEDYKVLEMPRN